MLRVRALALIPILLLAASCGRKSGGPVAADEALDSLRVHKGFKVELFASEPHVVDPVEMVFDENGRVYAAEMIDYPDDPPAGKPARSRIRLLEDTDGDGRIDRGVNFAEQVLQVSGLLPWKGGLIVSSAPDILYMKDTDGDGRADIRKVLYTGFPRVNPEARITNLRLGIDNWVYAANTGSNGRITSPEYPQYPELLIRGADFRFHPLTGAFERTSGPAQFGLTFDDWGNRFITQNTIHIRHVVVPMRYLARAPYLEVPAVAQDISDHGRPNVKMFPLTGPQQWRIERTKLRQQRYDELNLGRTEYLSGYITGASGGTVYNGDVFPHDYWNSVFTADVSGNLVHVDLLSPDGVTFSARRAVEDAEFLASTDPWFRPCHFANAPDGNLYLMDIYREFIETPESIPEEIKKGMDFWSGADKGRIFRIVPEQPLRKRDLKPKLGSAGIDELVGELENTNGWHRQTAQRLLLERQDRAAVPPLRKLAETSRLPQARLHALWTLDGLGALEPADVSRALADPHPRLREHAVRLAEALLKRSRPLADTLLGMAGDGDARVRFQLALTLGEIDDRRALPVLADLACRQSADDWFRIAVLSSAHARAADFFHLLVSRGPACEKPETMIRLAAIVGAQRDPARIASLLDALGKLQKPEAALSGLAQGLKLAGAGGLRVPGAEARLGRLMESPSEPLQTAAWEAARFFELRALTDKAAREAASADTPPQRRTRAVLALRGGQYAAVAPVLGKVLESNPPSEVQVAAITALAAFDGPEVAPAVLARWDGYTPQARQKALEVLLSRKESAPVLLESIESGKIGPNSLDAATRSRLLDYPDARIAERAKRLLSHDVGGRAKLVQQYQDVLRLSGEVARGRKAFEDNCARCHTARTPGSRVGPDLSGINNKTKEELLTSILNPSYAIDPRYVNYLVTTKDGRIYDGILANETPGAVTLRNGSPDGDQTILRSQVADMRASSVSVMPDELETSMSRQDIADVIAFLRGGL